MFIICTKIVYNQTHITAYTDTSVDDKNKVIYPSYNKIGFYSKSIPKNHLIQFKGGFNLEKCEFYERIALTRKWYFETQKKLPRKIKKNLLSTKDRIRGLAIPFDIS